MPSYETIFCFTAAFEMLATSSDILVNLCLEKEGLLNILLTKIGQGKLQDHLSLNVFQKGMGQKPLPENKSYPAWHPPTDELGTSSS